MIMAAGLGTRLRPLTHLMPKPMAPVLNIPVMEHIVALLERHGFDEIVTNLSYMPEAIRERLGDGSRLGVRLSYSEEAEPLGTAGGVGRARDFLAGSESFLVISGDALTDVDLSGMRDAHQSHGGLATLATKRVKDTTEFGVVISGEDARVQGFQEKPDPAEALSDLANCGIYMFRREIFDHFPGPGHRSPAGDPDQPEGFVDWAMDVLPALLESDVAFYSHEIDAYWNDIGTVSEFVQGNVDALSGAVSLRSAGEKRGEGVLVGTGCEIADGAELKAPVVIGEGVRIGAGARIRGAVVLAGAEVPAGSIVFGGVFGTDAS
jgi:mannose-1-phosphate guanylyltransferase